MDRQRKWTCS